MVAGRLRFSCALIGFWTCHGGCQILKRGKIAHWRKLNIAYFRILQLWLGSARYQVARAPAEGADPV